jgi:hypothetical protein
MLPQTKQWSYQWCEHARNDHGNAQKNADSREAKHGPDDDEHGTDHHADQQAAKSAFRGGLLVG